MRKLLNWIRDSYGQDMPIYITENGISDRTGQLNDTERIGFLEDYLNEVLKGRATLCSAPTSYVISLVECSETSLCNHLRIKTTALQ